MKLLEKNESLPRITMKELEQKIRGQNHSSKKGMKQTETMNQQSKLNNLQVLSPFYRRTNKRKQTCECQYHKFKRAFPQSKTHPRHEAQHQQCCSRFKLQKEGKVKQSKSMQSTSRFLVPLNARMTLKHQLYETDKLKNLNNNARKSQIISTQNMSNINDQLNGVAQFQKLYSQHKNILPSMLYSFNTINEEYIKLVNKRLQNNDYKDKYLKTLFRFIKMKANHDKQYVWQSRAYIVNNLNIILNHFKMDQLIKYQQLGEGDLQKICSIIKCPHSKIPMIFKDLKKVVLEMQQLLEKLKKQQIQNDKNLSDNLQINNTSPIDGSQRILNLNGTHVLIKQNQNQQQTNYTNKCNNILAEAHLSNMISNTNIISKNGCDQDQTQNILNSFLQRGLNMRKSVKLLAEPQQITLEQTIPINNQQIQNITPTINNFQINRKSQLKTRKSQIVGQMRKSVRVSTLGMMAQNQKDSKFYKKVKKTKHKKVQFPKIYTEPELDQIYLHIQYQQFCTKSTFIKMINEVTRLDRNNHERALAIYKHLNVQSFIDNKNKIELLINNFQPLFNQQSKQEFQKLIIEVKDRRFIQNLEHQLDFILGEIKKNDPRIDDDFYQIIPEKKTQNNVVQFKQHQPETIYKIDHIIYYEANQQIQKLQKIKKDQQLINLQLKQTHMNEIMSQTVKPTLTQSIYHFTQRKPQDSLDPLPKFKNQKQILRFMKKNHSVNFEQLADRFYGICKSLSKDKQNKSP